MTAPPADAADTAEDRAAARFRRILMAVDSTPENLSTVESVADLAARLEAELLGLFVEDIDLLRLAEHPEASAFSLLSAGRQHLTKGMVQRALRAQAARGRRAVEDAAARRRVKSSFQVRRGRVAAEVLALAEDADLVIVGWSAGGFASPARNHRRPPGTTARAVAAGASGSVLVLRHRVAFSGPVLAVFDGSADAAGVIAAAAQLADREGAGLEIVLATGDAGEAGRWRRALEPELRARGLPVRFVGMPDADLDRLCRTAMRDHATIMVLGAASPLLAGAGAADLFERIDCSVLLVR
jgi:K+-sensing histidine kinase KdpD